MISTTEAAAILGIARKRLSLLCKQRRVPGARLVGRVWLVPEAPVITPGTRGPKRK